jgi:hypothetical protein
MSIDRSKLPPKLQDLLKTLEEKGVNVEVIAGTMPPELRAALGLNTGGSSTDSRKDDCGCPACTARRALSASAGLPAGLMDQIEKLSDRTAERMTSAVAALVEPIRQELQRQVEINDANMARIAELNTEFNSLRESHRKQVGLLHRRVTKRKGEIGDVKVRVATTRGRVTRVEKKVS